MIVLLAPYPKMKEIADVVRMRFDIPIQTMVGNLQDALEPARAAIAEGKILVSRGGTAKLIHDSLGVEVIDIGISQIELTRVLKPFIGSGCRVAVIGFRSLTERVEQMCRVLDIMVTSLPVDYESEVDARIKSLSGSKIDCVIGDMVSIRSAEGLGLELHLIESDEFAIAEALEKAVLVAKRTRLERDNDLRMKAVFNSVQDAIIGVDSAGNIDHANAKASELFGISNLHGMPIRTLIKDFDTVSTMGMESEVPDKVLDVNGRRTVLNITPIAARGVSGGAVIVLQELGKIQAIEKKVRSQLHEKGLVAKYTFSDIFTRTASMEHCVRLARQYAKTGSNIVLYGETGTGKELLAQSIHNASPVHDGPFVAVNCGALPPSLLESELFGYVEGAFTGANKGGKAGLFELAHGGTIFLDEINELDLQLQTKLLRVLQERQIMRIGDTRIIPVSVRIIVASNVMLAEAVEKGRMRKDLYYRLNVLEIRIPPLRERSEDIVPLFKRFVEALTMAGEEGVTDFPESLVVALRAYSWPGNVRELENFAERYIVLWRLLGEQAAGEIVNAIGYSWQEKQNVCGDLLAVGTLKEIERELATKVFEQEGRNISAAARRLGIDRQTLRKLLGRHR
jgi:transcriptional regulator with PAS, ATPase and Fis domain